MKHNKNIVDNKWPYELCIQEPIYFKNAPISTVDVERSFSRIYRQTRIYCLPNCELLSSRI